jgi:hypothetical protein
MNNGRGKLIRGKILSKLRLEVNYFPYDSITIISCYNFGPREIYHRTSALSQSSTRVAREE